MKRRILFGKTDEASGEVLYIGMLCRGNERNKAANGDKDIAKMQNIETTRAHDKED